MLLRPSYPLPLNATASAFSVPPLENPVKMILP